MNRIALTALVGALMILPNVSMAATSTPHHAMMAGHAMKSCAKSSMKPNAMRHDAMKPNAMKHDAMKPSAMKHDAMKHTAMKSHAMKSAPCPSTKI